MQCIFFCSCFCPFRVLVCRIIGPAATGSAGPVPAPVCYQSARWWCIRSGVLRGVGEGQHQRDADFRAPRRPHLRQDVQEPRRQHDRAQQPADEASHGPGPGRRRWSGRRRTRRTVQPPAAVPAVLVSPPAPRLLPPPLAVRRACLFTVVFSAGLRRGARELWLVHSTRTEQLHWNTRVARGVARSKYVGWADMASAEHMGPTGESSPNLNRTDPPPTPPPVKTRRICINFRSDL